MGSDDLEMNETFDSVEKRMIAIKRLNAFVGGIMILGKQLCKYIDAANESKSDQEMLHKWSTIAPLESDEINAFLNPMIEDLMTELFLDKGVETL